ncbi:MAG: hypothetical protein CSA39_05855 [Flavobacteriales bacterium]|nr:MAG: hypothetical protein CSA39_05855 [Flavobacteriales bacterium]
MSLSHQILIYFFTILLVFKSVFNLYLTVFYQIDRAGFIEKYCENIDKPDLKCNGKCKMTKMALETSSEEKKPEFTINIEPLVFIIYTNLTNCLSVSSYIKKAIYFYLNGYTFLNLHVIDHPPEN